MRRATKSGARLGWAGVLLVAIPLGLAMAQPPRRAADLRWVDGILEIDVSLADFADDRVRARLESGLPQVLELSAEVVPAGGGPRIARTTRTAEVIFDLWEQRYRVREVRGGARRAVDLSTTDEVVERCLSADGLRIGDAAAYAGHRGEAVEVELRAQLDPLTPEMVHRIRRWLARPGGAAEPGDTFFGSFVGLFVNRSVAGAEAELSVRTEEVRVPEGP